VSAPALVRGTTPAGRVLCALIVVAALATAPLGSLATSLSALTLTALVLMAARPGLKALGRGLLAALLVIVALMVPFLAVGRGDHAVALSTRAIPAVLAAIAFASTFRAEELGAALYALRVPPVLANVVATLLRQLEAIRGEAQTIGLARRLRGARGPALGADAVAMLLIRVAERAERAELAQQLRGFGVEAAAARARLRIRDALALSMAGVAGLSLHLVHRLA
jgi:hypothetical protein